MKFLNLTACFLSTITMVVTPFAEAKNKENQRREQLEQYLKNINIQKKNLTVREFWLSVRHAYPQDMRTSIDRWVSLNREQLMPTAQVTNFKDANGVEQVRLMLSRDGQSVNITFTGNEDFPLKVNGVSFSKKEVNDHDLIKIGHRLIKEDSGLRKAYSANQMPLIRKSKLVFNYKEFKTLSAKQKAEYLIRLRYAMEAATKVLEKSPKKKQVLQELNEKYLWAQSFLLGDKAYAESLAGQTCVIAGFISVYGENESCGGIDTGSKNLSDQARSLGARCGGDATPCNPLVYGFDSDGNSFCVAKGDLRLATSQCNTKSPLNGPEDKKRIIESFLKVREGKKSLNLDIVNDAVSEDQYREVEGYLNGLSGLIANATTHCDQARKENRDDQTDACNALRTRSISLSTFAGGAVTPPAYDPPPPGTGLGQLPGGDCESQKIGSLLSGDGQSCLCPEGTEDGNIGGRPACIEINMQSSKYQKSAAAVSSCGFFCRNKNWIVGLGVGALAFGAIWWITKGKNKGGKSQSYTPPAGPAQDICVSPMTLVNGVCQIPATENPAIVEPPIVPTEGSSGTDSGGDTGGVR